MGEKSFNADWKKAKLSGRIVFPTDHRTPTSPNSVKTSVFFRLGLACMVWPLAGRAEPDSLEQLQRQLGGALEQVEELSNLVQDLRRDMKAQEDEVSGMRERAMKLQTEGRRNAAEAENQVRELKARLAASEQRVRELEAALSVRKAAEVSPPTAPPVADPPPIIAPVFYGIPESQLAREYERVLKFLKVALAAKTASVIRLTGHSNQEGDETLCLRQSAVRAEALATYLTNHGVPRNCLEVVAAGAKHPLNDPNSKEGRRTNRRVDVEIVR